MNTKALRQKILDLAIHGKLVPQDPNDEPASVLLERIKAEKERLIKEGKIKRTKRSKAACDKPHYPYELPEGWCWTTIEEVGEVVTGSTPSKDVKDFYGGNIPFFKPTDLEQGIHTIRSNDRLTALGFEQSRKLPINSVLVTCIGATIGKTGLTSIEGTCNQQINAIIPTNAILPHYLYYVCISDYMQNEIKANASATTLPILNKGNFSKIFLPLPPLREQKHIIKSIVNWLSIVNSVEESKENLHEVIKQTKSKILDLAIHGKLVPQDPNDEPATELLKHINPKAEITCDNPHYRKLPFQIPSTWVWCSHNDVLEISGGSQPAKRFFSSVPQKGYVRLYQIRDYGENPIPVYIPNEYAMKQTEEGDILLARYGGSLGKVFHAKKGAYNVAMAKVIFKDKYLINKEYAYFYYLSDLYQGRLKEISRTAQAGFNSSDFNEMFFPLPPYEEQQRIVNAINKAFTTLDVITENL